MKTLIKAALAATAATALFASPAFAQAGPYVPVKASVDFTAKAKIMKPLTLANDLDLDFGTILMKSGLVESTVRVGRSGGTAFTCDAAFLDCSGPTSAATFTATGVRNQTLVVSVDLTVDKLVSGAGHEVDFAADAPATVILNNTGSVDFDIGGSIVVRNTTVDGDYSALVPVEVSYQ